MFNAPNVRDMALNILSRNPNIANNPNAGFGYGCCGTAQTCCC